MKLLYTRDEGEGEILARRRGRCSEILSGALETSGLHSHLTFSLTSKVVEHGEIDLEEPSTTSSFRGSGGKSIGNDGVPTDVGT